MNGSRHQDLNFCFRIGAGLVLLCVLFVRVGMPSPVRINSDQTVAKSNHYLLKPRLLDPRVFDWSAHTQVFSILESAEPGGLITYSPEESRTFHAQGLYSNRAPPA